MKTSFNSLFQELKSTAVLFDAASALRQKTLLRQLSGVALPRNDALIRYYYLLLFMKGYLVNAVILKMVQREEKRITAFLRKNKPAHPSYKNSGLPFVSTEAAFSYDLLQWLQRQKSLRLEIGGEQEPGPELQDLLALTLPAVERDQAFAGYEGMELPDALDVPVSRRLSFLMQELDTLHAVPLVRDFLLERIDLKVRLYSSDPCFSRGQNRFDYAPVYFQGDLLKRFDYQALLDQTVPAQADLSESQIRKLADTIKTSLVLLARETDPVTYMDERSLRLYELERGISVAIFGMVPERQLPFESYVGYTLMKNGYPAAYGGGWVFGRRALFGINIFEAFRGGESGFMMCQLLRLYRQVFGVDYIEVEPYQFGKDNPEGIESGAFWFYYRYGFRPVDKELRNLAAAEMQKISSRKDYRSSRKTLERFTGSNVALNLGKTVPLMPSVWTQRITRMISRNYFSNRSTAITECIHHFCAAVALDHLPDSSKMPALTEASLLACALDIKAPVQLKLLAGMAESKPIDLYKYQDLLLKFHQSL